MCVCKKAFLVHLIKAWERTSKKKKKRYREACVSFLMGGTGSGKNWVLFFYLLSKTWIHFSVVGLCSLLGSCLTWGDPVLGSVGSMVGLMVTSERLLCQGGPSRTAATSGEPLLTGASTGGPSTIAGCFGSVSCGVTAPFFWSWCKQDFVSTLQDWSLCFPRSSGSPIIKSCWSSRSDSLGLPSAFVGPPGWEAWYGVQNLHNGGRTSLVLCSQVCGSLTQWVWDLILSWLCPSYHLAVASLSLDIGYLFLLRSGIHLLMVVQQLVAVLVFSKEEMSTYLSTPPFGTRNPSHSF